MVYISCSIMTISMGVFIYLALVPSLPILFGAAIIFGLGYGAYQSVDWALALDVIPPGSDFAKDMGIWHVSLVLPQVIAPFLGGALLTAIKSRSISTAYSMLFFFATVFFGLSGVFIFPVKLNSSG
eukprot:TRINITY_DN8169_c0_g1_i1.p1 TRINITY_DN8169_c0_g1~~TRINITY_DN8169_c0_g1_i1.p1  ORF type:complete len:126 (-),score=8.87 TRINITY_DN8169_c0_g1_i1:29-406(-)